MQCPIYLHEAALLRDVETIAYFTQMRFVFRPSRFPGGGRRGRGRELPRTALGGMRFPRRASAPSARVSSAWPKRCGWRASRSDAPWISEPALDCCWTLSLNWFRASLNECMASSFSHLLRRSAAAARTTMSAPLAISTGRSTPAHRSYRAFDSDHASQPASAAAPRACRTISCCLRSKTSSRATRRRRPKPKPSRRPRVRRERASGAPIAAPCRRICRASRDARGCRGQAVPVLQGALHRSVRT